MVPKDNLYLTYSRSLMYFNYTLCLFHCYSAIYVYTRPDLTKQKIFDFRFTYAAICC